MVQLGTSTLDVYPLCLGNNTFGWTSGEAQSHLVLDAYADAGGNFLDTADVYPAWAPGASGGDSEIILGAWLKRRKRDELVVATKVGKLQGRLGLAAGNVKRSAEESLRRLQTDYIDLYYAHAFDEETPLEESVAAFAALQREGKIREIGVSNFSAAQLGAWMAEADRQDVPRPVALQPHYNLLARADYEQNLQPLAAEFDLGVMPYFSLASGLLTGKYRSREQIVGDRAGMIGQYLTPATFEVIDALVQVADEHNVEPASVAIAWLLANPTVTAPVASGRNPEQVGPLLEGVGLALSDADLELLNSTSAKVAAL